MEPFTTSTHYYNGSIYITSFWTPKTTHLNIALNLVSLLAPLGSSTTEVETVQTATAPVLRPAPAVQVVTATQLHGPTTALIHAPTLTALNAQRTQLASVWNAQVVGSLPTSMGPAPRTPTSFITTWLWTSRSRATAERRSTTTMTQDFACHVHLGVSTVLTRLT